jgi:16S rRNA processing protein RimM
MEQWVTLARIVRPQGRRGELLSDLFTDFPEQFTEQPRVSLLTPAAARIPATVESHWMPTGRSAGRIVLKFAGTDSITDAEKLAGYQVQIPAEQRLKLDDETHYVEDLIGCTLVDGENEIGIIEDLHFPLDSEGRRLQDAASIFVVKRPNGDELLIPFANAFVRNIDTAAKRIEMNLPGGLLEMNG